MIRLFYAFNNRPMGMTQFENRLKVLPNAMQQQVLKYRHWQNAQGTMLGKLLLYEGALRYFQRENVLDEIQYDNWKRPFIKGNLDFNISHSGELVVCAISSTCRVGIDIEKIIPIDLANFQKNMTHAEWEEISGKEDPIYDFYHFWTRKEASIKADGRGMSIPLQNVRLLGQTALIEGKEWFLQSLQLEVGYLCCLAFDHTSCDQGIFEWECLFD